MTSTRDTDYGDFFPLDEGGFPEDYPLEEKFHFHVAKMGRLLNDMKKNLTADDIFLRELRTYKRLGFSTFYRKCMSQYERIFQMRLRNLEEHMP